MIETKIVKEPIDVEQRLGELDLSLPGLLKVRGIALASAADATPFHPANAAGTFSYHYGTWALREEFVGKVWHLDRPDGVEAIRHDGLNVKIVFANVDVACNDDHPPKPRSRKGAGAERICDGNLFGSLPHYTPKPEGPWAIYYLMVDEAGAAELTCPIIKNGTFSAYIERIYLSDGEDLDRMALLLNDDDVVNNFDPQVARK